MPKKKKEKKEKKEKKKNSLDYYALFTHPVWYHKSLEEATLVVGQGYY
jgi:hypothetical protein